MSAFNHLFLDFRGAGSELTKSNNTDHRFTERENNILYMYFQVKGIFSISFVQCYSSKSTRKKKKKKVLSRTEGMNKRKSFLFFEVWLLTDEHFASSIIMLDIKTVIGIKL